MKRDHMARIHLCRLVAVIAFGAVPTKALAVANSTLTIFGFAQTDYIYDVNRVDPSWESALRPSKIPTVKGVFGSDGQSSFSAKQTRFGVKGDTPVGGNMGAINFKFEFDLFGVGDDASQTTFRLRHAYGEWGSFLVGQTNSVFMDGDVYPNVVDYWGPSGMVYLRNPQFRWTPYRTSDSNFAIAIERPANDVDPGTLRELDPALGTNLKGDEKLPDLTAHYYTSGSWGHAQLAGILREVAYDTAGTQDNEPKGSKLGWGIGATGHLNALERDKLIGSLVYGEGIANYMNDGGVDLAPRGDTANIIHAKAVPLLGVSAYYDHYWNNHLSTSLGYSFTQVDNTNLQERSAFHKGEYASMNLLYTPTSNFLIGGEVLWGKRTDNSRVTGDDWRFQLSVKYDFAATITQ